MKMTLFKTFFYGKCNISNLKREKTKLSDINRVETQVLKFVISNYLITRTCTCVR